MKAMILAAGAGTRLDPLTRNIPKPMVPIVNKPVMEHIVELLASHGFNEIMVNIHYLGHVIKDYFRDGSRWGVKIYYSEEEKLLGTAGGVRRVADFFDDTFIVIGGDDLADFNLTRLIRYHKEKRALATIVLSLVEDPSQFGIALTNERGRITRFVEKPKSELIFSNTANTGVYAFEPEVLDLIPSGEFYDFGLHLFPKLLQLKKPFYGLLSASYWSDVGHLEQYRAAHYDALNGRVNIKFPCPETRRYVWMGENVEIDDTAEIGYPVLIGPGCRIEAGAKVLEDSVLGPNCIVEQGAIVRRSILWEGAVVMRDTILDRCVVGAGCKVKSNAAVFDGVIVSPTPNHLNMRNSEH
jgi:mannose-1-phosphate guanylyltransferase/phosphomannomutase